MNYSSLNYNSSTVSFLEAVKKGLAPDRGLYFPEKLPTLSAEFISQISSMSNHELAFHAIHPFIGEDLTEKELKTIIEDTLRFEFPVVPLTNSIASLELFHGPTLAFKDVGARFMARCLAYTNKKEKGEKGEVIFEGSCGEKQIDCVVDASEFIIIIDMMDHIQIDGVQIGITKGMNKALAVSFEIDKLTNNGVEKIGTIGKVITNQDMLLKLEKTVCRGLRIYIRGRSQDRIKRIRNVVVK